MDAVGVGIPAESLEVLRVPARGAYRQESASSCSQPCLLGRGDCSAERGLLAQLFPLNRRIGACCVHVNTHNRKTGVYTCQQCRLGYLSVLSVRLPFVGRRVDLDDLIDAAEVASILGLARANSVYVYQARYPDMPRPVLDRGPRQAKLWLRSEVEVWSKERRL